MQPDIRMRHNNVAGAYLISLKNENSKSDH
jgi:hypothetical protein